MGEVKKTPLFSWHRERKANFSEFGGYEMPLWYGSARAEHLSVLTGAGIFDTSHMAAILLRGVGARGLLNRCFSRDLERAIRGGPLVESRLVYGVFLDEDAHVIDDAIVYQVEDELYFVVVNASMGSTIASHLLSHRGDAQVEIEDMTDRLGKIDLQGPLAPRIIERALKKGRRVLEDMPYFSFKGFFDPSLYKGEGVELINGVPVLLSRSGYTGEIGFEIYCLAKDALSVWELLFEVGEELGLMPCGLAARDSLRAGACLPLSHQDIGHWPFLNNPWDFCLPWEEYGKSFSKDFIGREALESLLGSYSTYTYPFLAPDLRKVNMEDEPRVLDEENRPIGRVLTCVTDMGISVIGGKVYSVNSEDKPEGFRPRGAACGFVLVDRELSHGSSVFLQDSKRTLKVTIVPDIRPHRTARMDIKRFL